MSLDFSSVDFFPTTRGERICKCRALAEEAMMLAYWGSGETLEWYLLVAKHWTEFADEMERANH